MLADVRRQEAIAMPPSTAQYGWIHAADGFKRMASMKPLLRDVLDAAINTRATPTTARPLLES